MYQEGYKLFGMGGPENTRSGQKLTVDPNYVSAIAALGADYAMAKFGGWWTSKRMPATASNVQQAILYRKGRSAAGASAGMRTAVCPHWGEVSIDDIYSGSAKGERAFTMHVLLGDVILVQPDAYAQVTFRVST